MIPTRFREEWQAIRDLAQDLPNVELARSLTNVLCQVRQNLPWAFDAGSTFTPGNPFPGNFSLTRRFWDNQCRQNPLPAPQRGAEGFVGGQCPVTYRVEFLLDRRGGNTIAIQTTDITGPLSRIWIETTGENTTNRTWTGRVEAQSGASRSSVIGSDNPFGTANGSPYSNPRFRIIRMDGLPDNCGDRPPTISYPATPPPTFINLPVTIGGQQREVRVDLPDLDVSNWPEYTFSPTIQIGDITARFDFGGVTVEYTPTTTIPTAPIPDIQQNIENINNTTNNTNNTVNNIENEIENVRNTVENINTTINNGIPVDLTEVINAIKCCCCENNVTYESEIVVSNSLGGIFGIPENTIAVIISGSDVDLDLIRTQTGGGDSPPVLFWGWYAVCYGNSSGGERIPLQFESHSVAVGEHAKAILVSPTHNARCSIVAIRKEKNCNEHG